MNQIKIKLTATLPDGKIATRKTHRPYTVVTAIKKSDGQWQEISWHSTAELAKKAIKQYYDCFYKQYPETAIVAVNQS